jgi:formylglycine-generating enzyme required for sulfatase activity
MKKYMMRIIFSIVFAFTTVQCSAQFDVRAVDKTLVRINDTLYASKYEVSNKLYRLFLSSQRENQRSILENQVDSVRWRSSGSPCEPYVEYYHFHPAFEQYPVVNITHRAAMNFCEWLTNEYNASEKKLVNSKVLFHLPTEQEWILAATHGDSAKYGWGDDMLTDRKDRKKGNYRAKIASEIAEVTIEPVKSNNPNKKILLHQVSGNVSEMVASPDIVKGGDWMHEAEFLELSARMQYNGGAEPFVGFRYFMIVK